MRWTPSGWPRKWRCWPTGPISPKNWTRLRSHLEQFHLTLEARKPVGRKLDFVIQELNREINTIGSKATDVGISQAVIEIKSELERLREQVQKFRMIVFAAPPIFMPDVNFFFFSPSL